ncbi:MAG: hypothetical protein JW889_00955 [Verrucomicrobia bacterium]|nr:hypothetical protein [Verrucomicrobiota bacterium]
MLTDRENTLRNYDFEGPEWIPTNVGISPATWHKYREELERIIVRHPFACGAFEPGSIDFDNFPPVYREGERFTDMWQCVWENAQGGLEGIVTVNPLADWSAFDSFTPPDPLRFHERGEREPWDEFARGVEATRRREQPVWLWVDRTFERLHFLRGYENLMVDFMAGEPKLGALIEMVVEYNLRVIDKLAEFKPDVIGFGDDLGTQQALMMNPAIFKKYLVPVYRRQFDAARKAGARVFLHSDGAILEAIPMLIDCGLDIINPQVAPNTLDGLARVVKGKLAIHLDLDRQHVLPWGTPRQVRAHIHEAVDKLGDPAGGLSLSAEFQPTVPLCNIEATLQTFEEVMYRFSARGGSCCR